MTEMLPNSLGRVPKQDISIGGGIWYYAYCANCGKDLARVLDTYLPVQFAFFQCNECAEKYGEIAGLTATPFDVFFQKVQDAMNEEYGRLLTLPEILVELDDASSVISKLEREGLGG